MLSTRDMLGSDIKSDREASTAATTAATSGITSTTPRCTQDLASEHESGGGSPQDWGDLRPFFVVSPEGGQNVEHLAGYDGEVDIPRPGTHREVARYLAARSALGRQRADMLSCKEATRPFSRMNREKTTHLLKAREQRSRREVEMAQNASLEKRGIDETLTQEMRGLNVLEQARHPRVQAVPLLSRSASSAGSKKGRTRLEMARITEAFSFVEDDDHRGAAVNVQGESLDDAWVTLLGSTLENTRHVRSVLLNRNSIGDRGVALLARSLRLNSSVETLSLGGNRVTDAGARSIADLLKSGQSSLKVLNLTGSTPQPVSIMQSGSGATDDMADKCIRAPGTAALGLALGDPAACCGCFLLSLNLSFQRVWDAGAIALALALRRPACHLEALGLSGTQLTDVAAEAFSRALMDGKSAGGEGREKEGEGRDENRNPQEEVLAGGGESSESKEEAGKGVQGRRVVVPCTLRRLDLSRNSITDKGARELAMGLQEQSRHHRGHENAWGSNESTEKGDSNNGDAGPGQSRLGPPPPGGKVQGATRRPPPSPTISAATTAITGSSASTAGGAALPAAPKKKKVERAWSAPAFASGSAGAGAGAATTTATTTTVVSKPALPKQSSHGVAPKKSPLTPSRHPSLAKKSAPPTPPRSADACPAADRSSGGLTSLDLAFNRVSVSGIAVLHDAISTAATGMVFLELRGNTPADNGSDNHGNIDITGTTRTSSSSSTSSLSPPRSTADGTAAINVGQLLQNIENLCVRRRESLRRRQELDLRRRASTAVAAVRAASSSSRPPPSALNHPPRHGSAPHGSLDNAGRRRGPVAGATGRGSGGGGGGGGDPGGSGHLLRRLPGCERSAAKPRPLEGALPLRGYYVSPLLDSRFDLLMLREPVGDPADLSLYVNRTRDKLEQRRAVREQHQQHQQDRQEGGRGDGGRQHQQVDSNLSATAADGGNYVPATREMLKKGEVVSPVRINLEREGIMAERRRLFYEDSDFAARKNARIAGRGRNKAARSQILTQKHSNTAFTRELLRGAEGVRCPRGLRAHYLGLQNFEYDWGAGTAKK